MLMHSSKMLIQIKITWAFEMRTRCFPRFRDGRMNWRRFSDEVAFIDDSMKSLVNSTVESMQINYQLFKDKQVFNWFSLILSFLWWQAAINHRASRDRWVDCSSAMTNLCRESIGNPLPVKGRSQTSSHHISRYNAERVVPLDISIGPVFINRVFSLIIVAVVVVKHRKW